MILRFTIQRAPILAPVVFLMGLKLFESAVFLLNFNKRPGLVVFKKYLNDNCLHLILVIDTIKPDLFIE